MSSGFSNIKSLQNVGIQKICIDSSGKDRENVYVCDSEGAVVKFSKNSLNGSDFPQTFELGDSTSASIAWNNDNLCVGYSIIDYITGSDKKAVGNVKNDEFDSEKIRNLLEFQLPITTIDINDKYLAAGSSDFSVKCKSLQGGDGDLKSIELDGEPVCVKIDPKNEYLAVASVDGLITIISLETFEVETTIKDVFHRFESIDVSNPLVSITWSKSGQKLFVPSKNCVKVIYRSTWQFAASKSFANVDSTEIFSTSAVSQCGKYLAASTMSNMIGVWDLDLNELLKTEQFSRNAPGKTVITSIEFAPFGKAGDLLIADSNKGICIFHPFEDKLEEKEENNEVSKVSDDEDDELVLSRHKKPIFLDEESMDVDDNNSRLSSTSMDIAAIKKNYGFDKPADIGALEEFGFSVGPADPSYERKEEEFTKPQVSAPVDYIPAPRKIMVPDRFVCNSSPMEVSQRYLKYNQHGIVKGYINEQAKTNTIDIEFHNKRIHGDINLDNFETNYELADISLKVIALASFESRRKEKELDKMGNEVNELDGENDRSEKKGTSELLVIPISSFDSQRWTITLPRKDGAIDVLVSETNVVVLTAKRNVRIFTISGVQRQIFTHPGPILTAACFDNRIAIASVSGSEFYEADNKKIAQWKFEVSEYRLDGRDWYKSSDILKDARLPISMGESLEWLSYSTHGKLLAMDSLYNLYMHQSSGLWTPIFDGSSILRSQSDGIFPIGIADNDAKKIPELRYIYCRGTKYPLVSGINAPTIVPIKIPFCQPESERSKLEHELYWNELAMAESIQEDDLRSVEVLDKLHSAALVKLFALAVKCNSDGRAADLAQLVGSSERIQMLVKYASKNKKLVLSDKVAEIGRQLFDEPSSSSRRKYEEEELRPTRKIVLGATKKLAEKVTPPPEDEEEEEDERNDSQADESLIFSQPIIPVERVGQNPFKRNSAASSNNKSVFDQLEQQTLKRPNCEEPVTAKKGGGPPAKKQAKLAFGGESKKKNEEQKENLKKAVVVQQEEVIPEFVKKSVTPYDLWLSESRQNLQSEYSGEDSEFSKFCIQQFRALSKAEKDEWKQKAQQQQQV
ncbi:unnamed protein product [Caenorhabditis angaria]|uniref:HMG box domain-containing protein n=1 Tax=Caenorhabditis angaria TaxID=860376 RepID=A0A9P1IVW1_9PELO|nr:unnamed protein product [Caenorhabditis angaria]